MFAKSFEIEIATLGCASLAMTTKQSHKRVKISINDYESKRVYQDRHKRKSNGKHGTYREPRPSDGLGEQSLCNRKEKIETAEYTVDYDGRRPG